MRPRCLSFASLAAGAEQVEAPRLETLQRVRLPVRLVRELHLVRLVVEAPPRALAVVPPVGDVVDAEQHGPAPERVDDPPAPVLLDDAEEARCRVRHARHEARARVGRERCLRFGARTRLRTRRVRRGERPPETARRLQRRASARHGLHRALCVRLREGVAHFPDDRAARVLHGAGDAVRRTRKRDLVGRAVDPARRLAVVRCLQAVHMLGEPDAVAHFGKFEEPPPARHALRRLHERHVPEVAVVVDERDAERGPPVRPHRPLRRDARGDADARAARRRLMDREAAGEATRANRLRGVIERPGKRVVRPVRARTGKRRRRDGQPHNQTQSKEVSFHDAL